MKKVENKQQYIISVVVPSLKTIGITRQQVVAELDYRDFCGITEAGIGWDDDLYIYSTEELRMIEQMLE